MEDSRSVGSNSPKLEAFAVVPVVHGRVEAIIDLSLVDARGSALIDSTGQAVRVVNSPVRSEIRFVGTKPRFGNANNLVIDLGRKGAEPASCEHGGVGEIASVERFVPPDHRPAVPAFIAKNFFEDV